MAKMIPDISGNAAELEKSDFYKDAPGKRGEAAFYEIARDYLPDDWTVICNITVNETYKSNTQEHQIDFLVIIPGKGVVNVDAKGETYSWHDGAFYLGNTRKDLFDIATQAIHTFDRYVKGEILKKDTHWGAFGRCLIFPLCDFKGIDNCCKDVEDNKQIRGIENTDRLQAAIPYLSHRDLYSNDKLQSDVLQKKLINELDKHRGVQTSFTKEVEKAIIDYYSKSFIGVKRTNIFAHNNKELENNFIRFTAFQQEKIEDILHPDNTELHVPGCAGSGKTLLAFYAAKNFLEQNKRVLYVCYNKNLCNHVKTQYVDLINEKRALFKIAHFDALYQIFNENIRFTGDGTEFRNNIFNKLRYRSQEERFDVILIDEAQDMDDICFKTLYALRKPHNSKIVIFSDDQQTIFQNGGEWKLPDWCKNIKKLDPLRVNLRNAKAIFRKDQEIHNQERVSSAHQVEGKVYSSAKDLEALIDNLVKKDGYKTGNIAVLAFNNEDLARATASLNIEHGEDVRKWLAPDNDWNNNPYIWSGCIQGFKGMETDCLILVGNIPNGILGHTAVTRAKLILINLSLS